MKREPRFPDDCKSCLVLPSRGRSNRLPPKPPAVKTSQAMLIEAKLEHSHFTFTSQEAQTGKVINRLLNDLGLRYAERLT
jgi:hypothetical protein